MIEAVMYFGLGFLVAALFALVCIPLVHGRAVRLTTRRVQAAAPLSLAEIQADKDQLRAEFAMSTRRLEMNVEQIKEKTTAQLADLGKKTEALARTKAELTEKSAAIAALEAQQNVLQDRLRISEEELALKTNAVEERERKLKEREEEFSKLGMTLDEKAATADGQRIEIVALRTQTTTLRDRTADMERDLKQAEERAARDRTSLQAMVRERDEERVKGEALASRVAHLERQATGKAGEFDSVAGKLAALETATTAKARELADLTRERDQARLDAENAKRNEQAVRDELAGIDVKHNSATESLRTTKLLLEGQLERGREERARLQQELATLKRQTETSWETERMENALLRERINDVSAEVARLMAALEGSESKIDEILGADDAPATVPNGNANGAAGGTISNVTPLPRGASLADRIRALQQRASARAPSAG